LFAGSRFTGMLLAGSEQMSKFLKNLKTVIITL